MIVTLHPGETVAIRHHGSADAEGSVTVSATETGLSVSGGGAPVEDETEAMPDMRIFEAVRRIVEDHLGARIWSADTSFEAVGADSLDAVELVMAVEEEFGIEVGDDNVGSVKTVRDLCDLVARLGG